MTQQQIDNIQLELGLIGLQTQTATYNIDVFTATASQVNFTLTHSTNTAFNSHVIVNGLVLIDTLWSISGTTMTLTTPSTVNDIVEVGYYY